MNHALDLLARHLADRRQRGQTRLHLSPASREALKRITQPSFAPNRTASPVPLASVPLASTPLASRTASPVPPSPAPTATHSPVTPAVPGPNYATAPSLDELRRLLAADASLTGLPTLRDQPVFATGSPAAAIALVGEAPGQEEERAGEPFVGPAGQLLDKILQAMQLDRQTVYLTNVVKFRPRDGQARDQGSANRKPTAAELAAFRPLIQRELELIAPQVIVALGASAHHGLLGEELPVGRARGTTRTLPGTEIPVLTTYHPSYLLRQVGSAGELPTKRLVWEDMLRALELAQLPVTEKMRNYFLPKR